MRKRETREREGDTAKALPGMQRGCREGEVWFEGETGRRREKKKKKKNIKKRKEKQK